MNRVEIYNKYNGLCAYTGKPLGDDWQVDHVTSKERMGYWRGYCKTYEERVCLNNPDNLLPACRIVNHYKRSLDLEGFRSYMKNFHIRLAKLPKTTKREATKRRIAYMNQVAELFDITPDKPFSGKFYFERIKF